MSQRHTCASSCCLIATLICYMSQVEGLSGPRRVRAHQPEFKEILLCADYKQKTHQTEKAACCCLQEAPVFTIYLVETKMSLRSIQRLLRYLSPDQSFGRRRPYSRVFSVLPANQPEPNATLRSPPARRLQPHIQRSDSTTLMLFKNTPGLFSPLCCCCCRWCHMTPPPLHRSARTQQPHTFCKVQ